MSCIAQGAIIETPTRNLPRLLISISVSTVARGAIEDCGERRSGWTGLCLCSVRSVEFCVEDGFFEAVGGGGAGGASCANMGAARHASATNPNASQRRAEDPRAFIMPSLSLRILPDTLLSVLVAPVVVAIVVTGGEIVLILGRETIAVAHVFRGAVVVPVALPAAVAVFIIFAPELARLSPLSLFADATAAPMMIAPITPAATAAPVLPLSFRRPNSNWARQPRSTQMPR